MYPLSLTFLSLSQFFFNFYLFHFSLFPNIYDWYIKSIYLLVLDPPNKALYSYVLILKSTELEFLQLGLGEESHWLEAWSLEIWHQFSK
jgi:hypothetical protein